MSKKTKLRFIVEDGKFHGGVQHVRIMDTNITPAVPANRHQYDNSWVAEMDADRLNMMDDPTRFSEANSLIKVIGRNYRLYTRNTGWNRRTGGANGIVCFLADGKQVVNVSSAVASVVGWKWQNDDSVDAGRPGELTRKLSYMLYRDDSKLSYIQL